MDWAGAVPLSQGAALCGLLPEPLGETPAVAALPGCHAFFLSCVASHLWLAPAPPPAASGVGGVREPLGC